MDNLAELSDISSLKSFGTELYDSGVGKRIYSSQREKQEAEAQVKALENRISKLKIAQEKSDKKNQEILEKAARVEEIKSRREAEQKRQAEIKEQKEREVAAARLKAQRQREESKKKLEAARARVATAHPKSERPRTTKPSVRDVIYSNAVLMGTRNEEPEIRSRAAPRANPQVQRDYQIKYEQNLKAREAALAELKRLEDRESEMLDSLRAAYFEKEEAYKLLNEMTEEAKKPRQMKAS